MYKNVLKRILDVFCLVLVVLLILSIIPSVTGRKNPDYVPGLAGYKFMYVLSGSMSPAIEAGDMIVAKAVETGDLKEGDIITFRTMGSTLVTHRIMGKKEDGSFITKGDANNVEDIDLKVDGKNIVGKYIFRIPKGGYIVKFIQSPIGLIIFILIPVIILIWGEAAKLFKEIDKEEKTEKKDEDEDIGV